VIDHPQLVRGIVLAAAKKSSAMAEPARLEERRPRGARRRAAVRQAGIDPFKPEETRNELKDEFGTASPSR
jgi:hypothetical protein